VFPIPPEVHWRDAKPVVLPGMQGPGGELVPLTGLAKKAEKPRVSTAAKMAVVRSKSAHLQGLPAGKAAVITANGLRYVDRGDYVPEPKAKRGPRAAAGKNDTKLAAAARELRDRYLEHINRGAGVAADAIGRYRVSRGIEGGAIPMPGKIAAKPVHSLPASVAAA
jgi:hypothetical protein